MKTKQYRVFTIFQSQKQNGLYSYGVMSVHKDMISGGIKKVTVLNTFVELKTNKDLQIYLRKIKSVTKIDKIVTNIQGFSKDSIYYPTLSDKNTEHRLATGYKDIQSQILYPKGILDHRNIKIDDSSDQIRYRFDFDTTKPIIYCVCMAIDVVKKDQFIEMMKALKE